MQSDKQGANHFASRIVHSRLMVEKFDSLVNSISAKVALWDDMIKVARELSQKNLSFKDFMDKVYPIITEDSDRKKTTRNNRVTKISDRIVAECKTLGLPTELAPSVEGQKPWIKNASAWILFNGVQGHIQHSTGKKVNGQVVTPLGREFRSIDDTSGVISKALNIAIAA